MEKEILSNLKSITVKSKKRIGRGLGSGRGAKSGRGTTRHQKARENIPLHFEGGQGRMVKRFPLLRGKGRNKPRKESAVVISVSALNKFNDGETVDRESLIKKGVVSGGKQKINMKILSNGKLERKLTVKLPVSRPVRQMIEKLGGQVVSE